MKMVDKIVVVSALIVNGCLLAGTLITEIVDKRRNRKHEKLAFERRLTNVEDNAIEAKSNAFINTLEINDIKKKIKVLEEKIK